MTTFYYLNLFFSSFTLLLLCRLFAIKFGITDQPNHRKHHVGAVPVIGGLAITLTLSLFYFGSVDGVSPTLSLSLIVLTCLGLADDKYNLSYKLRLGIQIILAIAMMLIDKISLFNLGNLFGFGTIDLGPLTPVITIFAVLGMINAINMIDGIDGLLGACALIIFSSLAYLFQTQQQNDLANLCYAFCVVLMPFMLMNLGYLGKTYKVFMGDAGSMMLGFAMIWLLLKASQTESNPVMQPITAIWIIAFPLMDMVRVIFGRLKRGHSPFYPDRTHCHHLLLDQGWTNFHVLCFCCLVMVLSNCLGLLTEHFHIQEAYSMIGFLCFFTAYVLTLNFASNQNTPMQASKKVL